MQKFNNLNSDFWPLNSGRHSDFYNSYPADADEDDEIVSSDEETEERIQRRVRRAAKINELARMRRSMCGIGTNRVKRRLSAKAKKGDTLALALLLALKAEEANIQAKINYKYRSDRYSDYAYCEKEGYISQLVDVCNKAGYKFGCTGCYLYDTWNVNCIIYFEIPGCRQISWHSERNPSSYPVYDEAWDHAEETTLSKIENAIIINNVIHC